VEETKATNKGSKAGWRKWLQGQWMVQYVPFILFLAVLAVVYIGNGHFADNAIRNTGKATRELKQLQYEYKTLQAEVIYRSKESELANAVAPLGLDRSMEPPIKIGEDTTTAR
jgi:cell division protein FtsL